jgi:hypothetical protein
MRAQGRICEKVKKIYKAEGGASFPKQFSLKASRLAS